MIRKILACMREPLSIETGTTVLRLESINRLGSMACCILLYDVITKLLNIYAGS